MHNYTISFLFLFSSSSRSSWARRPSVWVIWRCGWWKVAGSPTSWRSWRCKTPSCCPKLGPRGLGNKRSKSEETQWENNSGETLTFLFFLVWALRRKSSIFLGRESQQVFHDRVCKDLRSTKRHHLCYHLISSKSVPTLSVGLQDLTDSCQSKTADWKRRRAIRADELSAVSEVLEQLSAQGTSVVQEAVAGPRCVSLYGEVHQNLLDFFRVSYKF